VQLNLSTHVENFNQYLPNALHDALKLVTSNVKASKFLSIIERAFKFLKLWRISVIFIYIHPAGNLRRSNSSQLLHPLVASHLVYWVDTLGQTVPNIYYILTIRLNQ